MDDDRLFLTILRGPSPQEATPVLATEDEDLIRAVAQALQERITPNEADPAVEQLLEEVRGGEGDDE